MLRAMKQDMTKAVQFSNTFCYIDDLFSVNNEHFGHYINAIYPSELELKDTTGLNIQMKCVTETRVRESRLVTPTHLSILVSTTRGMTSHFGLLIFLILTAINIPANPTYGVYISQLVRYVRIWTSKLDFIHRLRRLSIRLLHQGFKSTLLGKLLAKFFKRHGDIIEKYGITLREMRLTIQD